MKDASNLSGILNVLDGVVDTPGRILVMTTNHPEVLDPALIRPGRIDKKLLLTYITYQDMANLIVHYFQVKLDNKIFALQNIYRVESKQHIAKLNKWQSSTKASRI